MDGLDGVRALAVVAVVVYHANSVSHDGHAWLPGGFFGVDVFFVISGYLITSILVQQWQDRGGIGLRNFWLRRARRLLPAVVALIATVIVVSNVAAPDAVFRLGGDVPAALFYVTNWWFIFHKDSYFVAQGRPPLLLHLWSLAIEEQFYVVWPLVLTLVLPRLRRLRSLAIGTAVAAVVSTALMAALFRPGHDASRVYFGTDTHAQGLLIGCTLGLVLSPAALARRRGALWSWGLEAGGTAGLAVVAVLMVLLTDSSTFTYRGGFLVVDVAAAGVVLAAASRVTGFGWLLGQQPLRWVGTRSYAIYLWHWPIDQWLRPHFDVGFGGIPLLLLQAGLTGLAAEASYRLVEQPVRSGRAQAWIKERFFAARAREPWILIPGLVVLVLAVDVLGAKPPKVTGVLAEGSTPAAHVRLTPLPGHLVAQARPAPPHHRVKPRQHSGSRPARPVDALQPMSFAPPRPPARAPAKPRRHSAAAAQPRHHSPAPAASWAAIPVPRPSAPTTPAPTSSAPPSPATTAPSTTAPAAGGSTPAAALSAQEPVLAIGDSVLLAASPALQTRFGANITIDAEVSRQIRDGISRLEDYRSAGRLQQYKTVLIDLGTNGAMTTSEFNQLVAVAAGVPNLLFVNTYAHTSWSGQTNAVIASGVASHPGVKLVNWASAAQANPSMLYSDDIHPNDQGAVLYSNLVVSALNPTAAAANPSPTAAPNGSAGKPSSTSP